MPTIDELEKKKKHTHAYTFENFVENGGYEHFLFSYMKTLYQKTKFWTSPI